MDTTGESLRWRLDRPRRAGRWLAPIAAFAFAAPGCEAISGLNGLNEDTRCDGCDGGARADAGTEEAATSRGDASQASDGDVAVDQQSPDSSSGCSPSSCPSGCCAGGVCTTAFPLCGTGGAACITCASDLSNACVAGGCGCEGAPACTGATTCCASGCADIHGSDPTNCGGCGQTCGDGGSCAAGACVESVSVAVSGFAGNMVFQDNGSDNLLVSANGTFPLAPNVSPGTPYAVTLLAAPALVSCTATAASGTVGDAPVVVPFACTAPLSFPTTNLPATAQIPNNLWGALAFDRAGDLLVTGTSGGEIWRVARGSAAFTHTTNLGISGEQVGLAYDPTTNVFYIATSGWMGNNSGQGQIYTWTDGATGAAAFWTTISAISNSTTSVAIAPPTFGTFGHMLCAASDIGVISCADLTTPSTQATIVSGGGQLTALAFSVAGVLYATDYGRNRIVSIDPSGKITPLATNGLTLNGPSALAIDEVRNRLYIVDKGNSRIVSLDLASGTIVLVTNNVDAGGSWYPAPMAFDGNSTIVFGSDPTQSNNPAYLVESATVP